MFLTYKEFKESYSDNEIIEFWNLYATKQGYKSLDNKKFCEAIIHHTNFNEELFLINIEQSFINGLICGCVDDFIPYGKETGYISFIVFKDESKIKEALLLLEEKVKSLGRNKIEISFFNPMRLSWIMSNCNGHEHNNRPGILLGSPMYHFLLDNGYLEKSVECSMHMDLIPYEIPNEMIEREDRLKKEGYTIDFYQNNKVKNIDTFLERLNNPMWSKEIPECVEKDLPVIFVSINGDAIGFTGPTIREESGRGYFAGIAVDKDHNGKGIGTLLFHKLCLGFKNVGVTYMTLFTGSNNKALEIYKKVGFTVEEKFATMYKQI